MTTSSRSSPADRPRRPIPASILAASALVATLFLARSFPRETEVRPPVRIPAQRVRETSPPPSALEPVCRERASTAPSRAAAAPDGGTDPSSRPAGEDLDRVAAADPWNRARALLDLTRTDPDQAVAIAAVWLWREDDASLKSLAIRELARLSTPQARLALSEFRRATDDPGWAELIDRALGR